MITIRKFKTDEEGIIKDILHRNFDEVNSKDYPHETIQSLKQNFSSEKILQFSKEREMWIAENEKQIIGTASLGKFNDDHYALTVFVNPDYHKHGIGRKLMDTIEKRAAENGAPRLLVPASITGEPFYLKLGYGYLDGRKEFDEDMNIKMVKCL